MAHRTAPVVWITGASSGIGAAVARRWARVVRATRRRRHSAVVGGAEVASVWVNRLSPALWARIIRSHPMAMYRGVMRALGLRRDGERTQRTASSWASVLSDVAGVLTFRLSRERLVGFGGRHLLVGLAFAWLAGIGRYWDHPSAELVQVLGLGSVVYVLVLGTVLWALTAPLGPRDWSWSTVVGFVAATSPPALLYAIPVERMVPLDTAATINAGFLGVVALWRVLLLVWFFLRLGRLGWFRGLVAAFLPLALIVMTLAALNLEHVVFDLMSGIRESDRSAHDLSYQIVFFLAWSSLTAAPVLVALYLGTILVRWIGRWRAADR